jgi:chorismate dehydratase
MRIRVGVVLYLNTEPLVCGLAEDAPEAELIEDVPSRLAKMLAAGQLDVAIVSSIEAFRHEGYRVVSDACIASRGPVLSVKLFCRVPPGRIRRLALDAASRTSTALARIVLAERYDCRPEVVDFPLDGRAEDLPADLDGVVVIGDRCMRIEPGAFAHQLDLGAEWAKWTGLPFVYAVWTARSGVDLGALAGKLENARDRGLTQLAEIADREADARGLGRDLCYDYLSRRMHYRLGPEERAGLEAFGARAGEFGLAPKGRTVEFVVD